MMFEPMTDEQLFQRLARGEMPVPYRYGLRCVHRLGSENAAAQALADPALARAVVAAAVISESSARHPA